MFFLLVTFLYVMPLAITFLFFGLEASYSRKLKRTDEFIEYGIIALLSFVPFLNIVLFLAGLGEIDKGRKLVKSHKKSLNKLFKCNSCEMLFRRNQTKYNLENIDTNVFSFIECPHCGDIGNATRNLHQSILENKEVPYTKYITTFEAATDILFDSHSGENKNGKNKEIHEYVLETEMKDNQIKAWSMLKEKQLAETIRKLSENEELYEKQKKEYEGNRLL